MEGSVLIGYPEVRQLRVNNGFLKVIDRTRQGTDYRRSAIIREHPCQRMTQGLSEGWERISGGPNILSR